MVLVCDSLPPPYAGAGKGDGSALWRLTTARTATALIQ
jgi:hypothetical protein